MTICIRSNSMDGSRDNMLKTIKSSINDVHIKRKIILIYLFGILIPIVIFLALFISLMKTQLNNRENDLVDSELTRLQLTINSMLTTTNNLAATYFSDKELSWALETYSDDSKEPLMTIRKIDSKALSNQLVQRFIQSINIYHDNKNLFETTYSQYLSPDIKNSDWYRKFKLSNRSTYVNLDGDGDTANIIFIRKLNYLLTESDNIVKIVISPSSIRNQFDSKLLAKNNCSIFLVNSQNQVVATNLDKIPYNIDESKLKGHVYSKSFDNNSLIKDWKLVIVTNRSIMASIINQQMVFLTIAFFGVLVFSLLLFYGLAHTMIRRMVHIAWVMDQSINDELSKITVDMGSDEIGIMANRYNDMIQRIQTLMDENLRTNDELQSTNEELIASIDDIENKERQIDELIFLDRLTNLANRFSITRFIDNHFIEMNENDNFSIGFLDIDNFKLINDTYGHDIGDEIIKHTGARLKQFESESIHIGRFGGDEFIITVKDFKDIEQLKAIHNDIRIALKEVIIIHNITFLLTISMGISLYRVHSRKRHELIKLADIALYKAKELGRDQIVLFENSMNKALSEKLTHQAAIREAIQQNSFILFYQPYYNIKTLELEGCEALLRWNKDCNLNISTQQVVHTIEEMGLMIDFGLWIIKEACIFAKKLNINRNKPLTVSINVSALQLMQSDFADKVLNIISETQVDTNYITLEMTESILMYSIEKGSSMINKLRNAGISISLDDFGTGYSSLKYFKELPITTLKIDKSFIDNIETNFYDEQLVDTMIQLAHNKNIQVIAEGVEATNQLERLKNLGCDLVQGYLLSRPIDENAIFQLAK